MSNQNFWPVMKQADKCVSCKIKGWKEIGENDVENGAVNGGENGCEDHGEGGVEGGGEGDVEGGCVGDVEVEGGGERR